MVPKETFQPSFTSIQKPEDSFWISEELAKLKIQLMDLHDTLEQKSRVTTGHLRFLDECTAKSQNIVDDMQILQQSILSKIQYSSTKCITNPENMLPDLRTGQSDFEDTFNDLAPTEFISEEDVVISIE